jgi:hypothetical protein
MRNRMQVCALAPVLVAVCLGSTVTAQDQQNCLIKFGNNCPFVMPFSGDVYLLQMGGNAAATTTFGVGTSPDDFTPYYTGLPNNPDPTGEVFIGHFTQGTTLNFGMYTTYGEQEGWAFSVDNDLASVISFSDPDDNLNMNGSIIKQTGEYTWLMYLDDALSYLYDDDDDDVLMQIRIAPDGRR